MQIYERNGNKVGHRPSFLFLGRATIIYRVECRKRGSIYSVIRASRHSERVREDEGRFALCAPFDRSSVFNSKERERETTTAFPRNEQIIPRPVFEGKRHAYIYPSIGRTWIDRKNLDYVENSRNGDNSCDTTFGNAITRKEKKRRRGGEKVSRGRVRLPASKKKEKKRKRKKKLL